jgi:hypothetical protein
MLCNQVFKVDLGLFMRAAYQIHFVDKYVFPARAHHVHCCIFRRPARANALGDKDERKSVITTLWSIIMYRPAGSQAFLPELELLLEVLVVGTPFP